MRLQQLQLLIAIAETGSLRASSRALNLTQSALSKSLQLLEDELGAQLVSRTAHGARLSPAGEAFAARAAVALRELKRGRDEVTAAVGGALPPVSVGLSPTAAVALAPGAVARFKARGDVVHVKFRDVLYPRSVQMVRSGELDFAVGPLLTTEIANDLASHELHVSRTVIVVRQGHPLEHSSSLATLIDAEWLLSGPLGGPGDPSTLGFEALGLEAPRPRLVCESTSTVLAMVSRCDMVCVLPDIFFKLYAARMNLVQVPVNEPLPTNPVVAIWRSDVPQTLSAKRMLDAFVLEAQSLG